MRQDERDPATQSDDDNPEWTAAEIRDARPAQQVAEEIFGPAVATALLRGPGRPKKADRKINQTLRLDADVVEAYRQVGRGWHSRMNQVLREHMPAAEGGTKSGRRHD